MIRRPALAVLLAALPLLALVSVAVRTSAPSAAAGTGSSVPAYWLVASDGGIFSFGGAPFYGSTGALALNRPIVGMAATPDGAGYWLVASDGGIFSYGDAGFQGSTGSLVLNKPIVGMTPTPDGGGYWLVASDGGIFAFGDAGFHGSTGSMVLNKPVVGMAATADGGGYWLVASDGGIFAFGDAGFHGSTGSLVLNKPVIGMIADPNGGGYFLVASDGGIFSFGTAPFYGSLGGLPLKNPIVAAAATTASGTQKPSGQSDVGYWFTDDTGLVSNFGSADYFGSAPNPLNRPIVGMAEAPGNGAFVGSPFPSGAYGYDISNYQCPANFPSGDHQIGIVQVDGASDTSTQAGQSGNYANPCLAAEAAWAGAGLNLYTFLTYQTSSTSEPGCSFDSTDACNAGYQAGIDAFGDAQHVRHRHRRHLVARRRERPRHAVVGQRRIERRLRPGCAERAARDRGTGERGHLRQPRRLELDRGRLPAQRALLDGRLPALAQRPGLVCRLHQLGAEPQRAATGTADPRPVQQPAVRRGLRLLTRPR